MATAAFANPTGPTVVHGTAAIQQAGNLLQVTNSPNAIINWQSFSIGANEITRFIQQSQASAVLNRVVGAGGAIDPSVILGALQSNGRVFLINPSGILFGAGAQVDVAGLVASSLNLSNADFLANRLNFTAMPGAGSVVNQGNITTGPGGGVYLVGPAVANNGIITSPQGEVILAAGNSVELVEPGTPNLRVEISAPDNEARNLGQIVADSGRVGIYAGLINHSGTTRADSAVAEGGRIVLKATKSITLESSSILDASGAGGGTIEVLATNGGEVNVAGRLDASAPISGDGGFVETSANIVNVAAGTIVRTGAANGNRGMWLIDPNDFRIAADGNMTAATLATTLNDFYGGDVTVQTFGAGGNLTVDESVAWSSDNALNLVAHNDVVVNQAVTNGGTGAIKMLAGWNGDVEIPGATPGVGDVLINAMVRTGGDIGLQAGRDISINTTEVRAGFGVLGAVVRSALFDAGRNITLNSSIVKADATFNTAVVAMQAGGSIVSSGSTIEAHSSSPSSAIVGLRAEMDVMLSGGVVSATDDGTGPSLVGISAGNNVTLGGNVTADGNFGSPGWFGANIPADIAAQVPSDFSGIGISAGNQIIGGAGVMSASLEQSIALKAVNGVGTQLNPVRILNGSETTGPDICCIRNLGSTGDISVSFVSGNIDINDDLYGVYNANPAGTFYINVEAGNFMLNAPFMPSSNLNGSDATNLNGQNLVVNASGAIILGPGANIVMTSGTTTLNGASVMHDSGGIGTGNVIGLLNTNASSGDIMLVQDSSYLLGSTTTAGGTVYVQSNLGGITIPGQINAGAGGVELTAPLGTVFGTGTSPDIIAGTLDITAASIDGAGGLHILVPTVNSLVANGGHMNVLSFGNVALNGSVQSSGAMTITSVSGSDIVVGGGGSIGATAGPITLSSGRDLIYNAGGNINNPVGNINLIAANDLLFNSGGVTTSSGIVNLVATNDLTSTGANFVSTGGSVGLLAGGNLVMSGGGAHAPAGTVGLSAGGDVNVNGANIGGAMVGLAAGNGVNLTGGSSVSATGDVVLVGNTVSLVGSSAVAGNLMSVDAGTLTVGPDGALLKGFDVAITADTAINLVSAANIEAVSPSSIDIQFPLLASGGIFVNGVEQIFDPATPETGFVVGGETVTSLPFPGFNVTFGMGGSSLPPAVTQAVDQTISSINQTVDTTQTEEKTEPTTTASDDPKTTEGDKDKKSLPVCK